jgi:hypothetical protein
LTTRIPGGDVPVVLHHPVEKGEQRVLAKDEISDVEPLLVRILEEETEN